MITKRCDVCGKEFEAEYDGKFMFCSDECRKEGKRIFSTITKECKNCGRKFEIDRKNTNYCCDECKKEANRIRSRENYKPAKPVTKVCKICGKEFKAKFRAIYCGDECKKEAMRIRSREGYSYTPNPSVIKVCKICGKEFTTNRKNTVCCSDECKKEYQKEIQKNWRQSDEGKAKLKKWQQSEKGISAKEKQKEKKRRRVQKKVAELIERYDGDLESILKKCPTHWMEREAIMQVEYGVSYYDGMRAKEKSAPVCEVTGVKNDLVIHHLNSFNLHPELGADPNNMVRVCDDVHKEFHRIYGYGNNTSEQWFEFIETFK